MERTNEEELDLFCDLLDPVSEILTDRAVVDNLRRGGNKIPAIKYAIKNHKAAVIQILARIDGVPVEDYKVSAITIPVRLLALVNLPEVQDLFSLAERKNAAAQSVSAMENTKDGVN